LGINQLFENLVFVLHWWQWRHL